MKLDTVWGWINPCNSCADSPANSIEFSLPLAIKILYSWKHHFQFIHEVASRVLQRDFKSLGRPTPVDIPHLIWLSVEIGNVSMGTPFNWRNLLKALAQTCREELVHVPPEKSPALPNFLPWCTWQEGGGGVTYGVCSSLNKGKPGSYPVIAM